MICKIYLNNILSTLQTYTLSSNAILFPYKRLMRNIELSVKHSVLPGYDVYSKMNLDSD